jgi:2-phospho-L-lactate guanylyltransferase
LVIPVKQLREAKSRLDDPRRPELAKAFAFDVMNAVRGCSRVSDAVVVTSDPVVVDAALSLGLRTLQDPDQGLNPAAVAGRAVLPLDHPTGVLAADLPCLDPRTLTAMLDAADGVLGSGALAAVVGDAPGTGTTFLGCPPSSAFAPAFGVRSLARHVAAGAVAITDPALPRARRDVDTPVDLWDALRLGVGPATSAALSS